MEATKMKELESLSPEKLEWLFDIASRSRIMDCVKALKEHGIKVSPSTLGRFLRRTREKQLVEDGAAMSGTMESLTKRGESQVFRKGTLEAVRQKLFEQALESQTAEETRKLYSELLKEEAKLKELELAARKVAVAEVEARWRRAELRRGRKRAEVVESSEVVESAEVGEMKRIGNGAEAGTGGALGTGGTSETSGMDKLDGGEMVGRWDGEAVELLRRVSEILNRGGSSDEKVVEARVVLGEGLAMLGSG